VTSLSEKADSIFRDAPSTGKGLEEIACLIERETGTRSDFCRLYGRRWAHAGGVAGAVIPEERLTIAQGWGVILENNSLNNAFWQEIGRLLTESRPA